MQFWEDVVKKLPGEGLPHQNLGLAFVMSGRTDDAEKEFNESIKAKNDNEGKSISYNNLGNIYLMKENFDLAEKYFAKAFSIQPNYAMPYYGMGLSMLTRYYKGNQAGEKLEKKFLESAVDNLNIAIQINPQYVKAHCLLGEVFFKLGQYDKAIKHLQSVFKYEREGEIAEKAKKLLNDLQTEKHQTDNGWFGVGPSQVVVKT